MAGTPWSMEYNPVGNDRVLPQAHHPTPGTRVRLTPTEPGVRRDPRYAHVSDGDGNPIGLVLKGSLMRLPEGRSGNPQPEATDRTAALFSDRRGA